VPADAWKSKAKTLARFTTLQTAVQAIMAVSGFLIIRVLSKSEYAAYTIAASFQTLLNSLTDCGVGTGLNAIGGRVWQDAARLNGLVAASLRLRGYLASIAIPLTVISAVFLLRKNNVSWITTVALAMCVIGTIWGTFLTTIYATPLRLRSIYATVQKFELLGATLRLMLIAALAFIFLNAVAAILVTAIALTVQGLLLRKQAIKILGEEVRENDADRRALVALIKKQAFTTIFFAYQGQITIWIISIFGSTEKIADVGALTRLAVVFGIVSSVLGGLVAPTFARCESLKRLGRLFAFALVSYLVAAGLLFFCSFTFPREVLWILGGKYMSLTHEVPLLVTSAIIGGLTGVIHTLSWSRGWVWHMWIIPFVTLLVQIIAVRFLPLNTVAGVLEFSIISAVPWLLVTSYMATRGFWTSWRAGHLAPVAS
jgi:O-antigen/teichoic acid export membrane protein